MEKEQRIVAYVHSHGRDAVVVDARVGETVADVLRRAQVVTADCHVFVGESTTALEEAVEIDDGEDPMEPVAVERPLQDFVTGGQVHVHCHRCRRIAVVVNYQSGSKKHRFAPPTRIETVLAWAKRKFHLTDADADTLLLQVCQSHQRPRPTQHLGEIVAPGVCAICFDVVPDQKVEGGC
jgi:hypothetical protein